MAPEDVQLYYQIAILGRRDLPLAPDPRTGFEMTLLRMAAFRPASAERGVQRERPGTREPPAAPSARGQPSAAPAVAGPIPEPAVAVGTDASAPAPGNVPGSEAWRAILGQLDLAGAARQLANHCALLGRQGAVVRLGLDPRNAAVRTRALEEKLAQALSRHYGEPVRLEFVIAEVPLETPAQAEQRASLAELEAARQALATDPTVRVLQERFGATLLPDSVRPSK